MTPTLNTDAGHAGPMHANAAPRFAAARHEIFGVAAPDPRMVLAPLY